MADDDQGAIPTDNTSPTQNATAPQGTQWGQSLGQDVGNVLQSGQSFGQDVGNVLGSLAQRTESQAAAAGARIKDYIMHKGAMPNDQYQALRQQIEQGGVTDPNDITAHAIVRGGPPATLAAGLNWDALRGAVGKAVDEGNYPLAAFKGNKALEQIPDGVKSFISAGKNGSFNFTVHPPNGDVQHYNLNPDEYSAVFVGQGGTWDHVTGKGVNGILDQITRATHPEGAFGGPPGGEENTSEPGNKKPGEEEQAAVGETTGKKNMAPEVGGHPGEEGGEPIAREATRKGTPEPGPATQGRPGVLPPAYDPNNPAQSQANINRMQPTRPYDPRADNPNADYGQGNETILRGIPYGGGKTARATPTQNDAYGKWLQAQNERNYYLANPANDRGGGPFHREPTFTNPDQKTEAEINAPVNVISPGRAGGMPNVRTFGNANTAGVSPEQATAAQEQAPNNVQRQSQILSGERNTAQEQQSKLNIAKNQRLYGTQAIADSRIQQAQIKAQSIVDGSDTRFNGETDRTTANLVAAQMKADAAAGKETNIGSAMQALRAAGVANPSVPVLQHIFNPQSQAPQRQQPAPQRQQPAQQQSRAQPVPPEGKAALKPNTLYTTPRGPMWWDGQSFQQNPTTVQTGQ